MLQQPDTIIPIPPDSGEPDATLSENHCAEKLGNAFLVAPIFTAGLDAATILDSFIADKGASKPFVASTCALTFLVSASLNENGVYKNLQKIKKIIREKKMPDYQLSGKEEAVAWLTTGAAIIVTGLTDVSKAIFFLSDTRNSYRVLNHIPPHALPAIQGIASTGVIITMVLTEGYETLDFIREKLRKKPSPYSHSEHNEDKSYFKIVLISGGILTILDAMQETIDGSVTMTRVFDIANSPWKYGIIPLNVANGITNFFFSGLVLIHGLNDFTHYVANRMIKEKKIEPKKIVAFSTALAISIYLAYAKRFLNEEFYQDAADNFDVNDPSIVDPAALALSWAMFLQESVLNTAILYSVTHLLTKASIHTASYTYSKLKNTTNYILSALKGCISTNQEETVSLAADIEEYRNEVVEVDIERIKQDLDEIEDLLKGIGTVETTGPAILPPPARQIQYDDEPNFTFKHFKKPKQKAETCFPTADPRNQCGII